MSGHLEIFVTETPHVLDFTSSACDGPDDDVAVSVENSRRIRIRRRKQPGSLAGRR